MLCCLQDHERRDHNKSHDEASDGGRRRERSLTVEDSSKAVVDVGVSDRSRRELAAEAASGRKRQRALSREGSRQDLEGNDRCRWCMASARAWQQVGRVTRANQALCKWHACAWRYHAMCALLGALCHQTAELVGCCGIISRLFWQVCSAQFLVMRNSLMNGCVVSEVPRGDTSLRACSLLSPPDVWTLAFHNFVVDIISTESERNHLCLRLWLLAALAMHERLTACCAAEKGSWHNHGG